MYTDLGLPDKNLLFEQHIGLVKKLAYLMKAKLPPCVEVDDLVQAGSIGLMDAVNRYDDKMGAQFTTYAVQRIRGAMLDELRSSDWVPRNVRDDMHKVETAISLAQQKLGRSPTEPEVARQMDVSLAEYQKLLDHGAGHRLVYYEDMQSDEESNDFFERYATGDHPDDPLERLLDENFRAALIDSIDALPDREKLMMGLYYEQDLNLKEIAAVLDVSESRVSQLHTQATARIRAMLRKESWI
ncbi:MAG: RNA polymerase sigma factor FliA [Proteobacteria bacterium]|nr:RNA polymerase sigma factor FliA [Pseudomonadota bacterium]